MTSAVLDLVVDGVEIIHVPSEDTITRVRLCFAVGARDEVVSEQGVLHVLEHLVMHAAKDTVLDVNASVGPTFTDFTASGPSTLVGEHLERLCRTLADPPLDRMPAEAPVVAAEIDGDDGLHQALLAARYGFRDLGSGAVTGPGPDGLRPEQVQAATRWFVARNAVLVIDGPLPPDLRLPLPGGGPRAHVRVPPRRRTGPAAVVVDAPACMVSLLLPPTDPMRLDELAAELVRQRLLDVVRHEKGLTYVVDDEVFVDVPHVDGGSGSDLMVGAEPPEAQLVPAVQAFVGALLELLANGPRAEELDRARERVLLTRQGRQAQADLALDEALHQRLGVARPPLDVARFSSLDAATVADYLRSLVGDVLFALPDDPALDLRTLGLQETSTAPILDGPLPLGERFRPPLLARALNSAARQAELALGEDGLHVRLEGEVQSVRWDDVVGVLEEDEHELAVFGGDGSMIVVGRDMWRGGNALVTAVRSHVDPRLIYPRSKLLSPPED